MGCAHARLFVRRLTHPRSCALRSWHGHLNTQYFRIPEAAAVRLQRERHKCAVTGSVRTTYGGRCLSSRSVMCKQEKQPEYMRTEEDADALSKAVWRAAWPGSNLLKSQHTGHNSRVAMSRRSSQSTRAQRRTRTCCRRRCGGRRGRGSGCSSVPSSPSARKCCWRWTCRCCFANLQRLAIPPLGQHRCQLYSVITKHTAAAMYRQLVAVRVLLH